MAIYEDYYGKGAKDYLPAVQAAHESKERIVELIQHQDEPDGPQNLIPRLGAVELLRSDPGTQGPVLFERSCSGCHAHSKFDEGHPARDTSAPNLDSFGSRAWVAGLLDPTQIRSANYFGNTAHRCGRMSEWIDQYVPSAAAAPEDITDDEKLDRLLRQLRLSDVADAAAKVREAAKQVGEEKQRVVLPLGDGELAATPASTLKDCDDEEPPPDSIVFAYLRPELSDIAAALSAQAQLPEQREADAKAEQDGSITRGIEIIETTCAKGCHRFGDAGQLGLAPDLTGYGSWEWMMGMVSDPSHRRYYGRENDRMQSYGLSLDKPQENQLSAGQISMIVDWLRDDYIGAAEEVAGRPHTQQEAKRAWEMARLIDAPELEIVGSPKVADALPLARAQTLFRQNCAACHNHVDEHGTGITAENPSAPNLYGFASRAWIDGLLDPEQINTPAYFGNTKHAGGQMSDFVEGLDRDDEELPKLVAGISAEAKLPSQVKLDEESAPDEDARVELFDSFACSDCHTFHDAGIDDAPDLTGYGSQKWITQFIANPAGKRFYGRTSNDRMPAFAGHPGSPARLLTDEEIGLLARYIRGEDLKSPGP